MLKCNKKRSLKYNYYGNQERQLIENAFKENDSYLEYDNLVEFYNWALSLKSKDFRIWEYLKED